MSTSLLPGELRGSVQRVVLLLLAVLAIGTLGYMQLEGWNLLDSVYMTVITLSTVGFGEIHPLSPAGRLFTLGIITAGVGTVAYLFGSVTEMALSGRLSAAMRRQRMQRAIEHLSGHVIVCGLGRVGSQVIANLVDRETPVVGIDVAIPEDADRRALLVNGNATDDSVLRTAGIERATGLVAATGDDALNIVITLSAHTLNPRLTIVSRANAPDAEPKLVRAGAAEVISPYRIGGSWMAARLVSPHVAQFLDATLSPGGPDTTLHEIRVGADSALAGKTVAELREQLKHVALLGHARKGAHVDAGPAPHLHIEAGDTLVVLGGHDALRSLAVQAGDAREVPRGAAATAS